MTLILDGSNLCHEGQKKGGKFKTLGALLPCLQALLDNQIEAYVIFDASFRWRLEKGSKAAREFEAFLKNDDRFRMAPAGTPADVFILETAALRGFGVLSNDTFRQYVERKGKGKEPHFHGKKIQVHSFQMFAGVFLIPSLGISCLIEEGKLDADEIMAARMSASQPHKRPEPSPASPTPASRAAGQPARVKPDSGNRREAKSADTARRAPRLDFLVKMSPLCLRARDVFEVHRQLTGEAWNAGNAKKTAREFSRECFVRNVVYFEPEGRKPNDGYFFDPRYCESRHVAVRSHLWEHCPHILPLAASARGSLLQLLDMIYDKQLAAGFDFQRLCDRADTLKLAYYRNYLRCLLYALIASDGVCGADPKETDIGKILDGEMHVTSNENRSDRLNFLQRGMLYLMAGSDNILPDVIGRNLSWMLQLPKDEKVAQAIIKSHIEWLAADEA